MATASITIDLDLPDGVEVREYERHGDGHAFHVAWPLPDRCRCDGCSHEADTRLEYKATFYTGRDLDIWGQPSFWVYQPPIHHCPRCGRRQHLLPPFKRPNISLKKRHQLYTTILTDLSDPARPEVLAVAPGRDRAAAVMCLNQLSAAQRQAVASHRTDMSPAYLSACQELLPNSQSVIDRFQVAKQLGEVADALRKK